MTQVNGAIVAFDPSKFAASVSNLQKGVATRVEFLKMDKSGQWMFGTGDTEVEEDDKVYIDPMGFVHGWQCWADTDLDGVQAELLGSIVKPSYEPLPEMPSEIPKNGRQWSELRGLSALLDGHKLVYTTTSIGGVQGVATLAQAFGEQYKKDPSKLIAVVNLGSESYKHKKYGKLYTPVFAVIGWTDKLPEVAVEGVPAKVEEKKLPPARAARGTKKA